VCHRLDTALVQYTAWYDLSFSYWQASREHPNTLTKFLLHSLLPMCTVATAVKAMCSYSNIVVGCYSIFFLTTWGNFNF
jgi:hypothetical protein